MRSRKVLALLPLVLGCYEAPTTMQPPVNPPPVTPPPVEAKTPVIEEFLANPATVQMGGTVELSYRVTDAETIEVAVQGDARPLLSTPALVFRFQSPALQATTTFILTATNEDKTASLPLTVMISEAPPAPLHASIQAFQTSAIDIMAGGMATLRWNTTNAAEGRLLANDAIMLTVPTADLASGMQVVSPGTTTVYTLVVEGTDGQEVTATTAVNVSTGGTALTGRELFDRNVVAILDLRCAACHAGSNVADGPDFMGPSRTAYYGAITRDTRFVTARPEDSLLILKGEHTGPAFTPTEAQTITAWLLKEADERGLAPGNNEPPPPPNDYTPRTVSEALTRFGACMARTDWDETYGQGQDTEVAYQNTTEGRCYACHSSGTAGAFLSQSSGDTFDQSRVRPYVLKLVLPTANEDGSFRDLVPAYRFRDKGGDQGHPSYQLTAERNAAMNEFVDRTLTKFRDYTRQCP